MIPEVPSVFRACTPRRCAMVALFAVPALIVFNHIRLTHSLGSSLLLHSRRTWALALLLTLALAGADGIWQLGNVGHRLGKMARQGIKINTIGRTIAPGCIENRPLVAKPYGHISPLQMILYQSIDRYDRCLRTQQTRE